MDTTKIAMLIATAGLWELSPEAEELASSGEFWAQLEATPEDALTPQQRRVLAEMGVNVQYDQ